MSWTAAGWSWPSGVQATIDTVASSLGVSPRLAEAIAIQESGGQPGAIGDQGTSYGLFQLHRGGELGALTPQQAFDPTTNASRSLSTVAAVARSMPGADPGAVAAAAQRPADRVGYAASVDAIYNRLGTPGAVLAGWGPNNAIPGPGDVVDAAGNVVKGAAGAVGDTLGTVAGAAVGAGISAGWGAASGIVGGSVGPWFRRNLVPLVTGLTITLVVLQGGKAAA